MMRKFIAELLVAFGLLLFGAMQLAFRGPKASDAQLIFRQASDGNLTADLTTTGKDCGPSPLDGVPFRLHIPTDGTVDDTLNVIFQESDTLGGTYVECGRFSNAELDTNADTFPNAGIYRKRIAWRKAFLRVFFDVSGTSVNYGAVDLRAESAGEGTNAPRDL
jgi:hypothetical protein